MKTNTLYDRPIDNVATIRFAVFFLLCKFFVGTFYSLVLNKCRAKKINKTHRVQLTIAINSRETQRIETSRVPSTNKINKTNTTKRTHRTIVKSKTLTLRRRCRCCFHCCRAATTKFIVVVVWKSVIIIRLHAQINTTIGIFDSFSLLLYLSVTRSLFGRRYRFKSLETFFCFDFKQLTSKNLNFWCEINLSFILSA